MNKRRSDKISEIVSFLNQNKHAEIDAFVGFDACIDQIVRVVKDKDENGNHGYFDTSRQFGEYLLNLENKSCGVELNTKLLKPGGNMVITGNALGNLGIRVECLGTFGFPEILPVFRSMSLNCKLHTIADTITATAIEFSNSKVIMFDPGPYENLTWHDIRHIVGLENLKVLLAGKQLVSFLNWSEIENSSTIWKGFFDEVFHAVVNSDDKPIFFTDFSDCSRKSKKEIQFVLDLLGRFRKYFKVIFSMNRNEAGLVAQAIDAPFSSSDSKFIKSIYDAIDVDTLTIHQTLDAIAFDGEKI